MSRKRLKDMLRKEMDERIKTYDTKPISKQPEKPSLKFDLKTDLLGKKTEVNEPVETEVKEPIVKSILKETSVKEQLEEPIVKEPIVKEQKKFFDKYLEEEDDDYSSSSDDSDSYSEEDDDDYYKQYKNKVKQIEEKHNSRNERKNETNFEDDYIKRKDNDRRRNDNNSDIGYGRDERRRDVDRDERRRDVDRDERRRDVDRDERRRDVDRDERRRDVDRKTDDIKVEPKVLKGNQFIDIPKKHILQIIKSKDVDSISADCVDEMKDILQDFTTHMFELFSDGNKVVIAERDDIKSYISLFIEDEDKELVEDLILSPKDIEKAVMNIAEAYNVKIKKDIVYIVHTFLESILVKVITGAKMINDMSKTKRISGKELRTAYKIYML